MMTDETNAQGRCLCGSVQVTAKSIHKNVGACHCKMCRTWGGGAFMAVECGTDVSFEGDEHISVFDSSKWADRGFCNQCGTHLFYRIKEGQQYMMPAGLFTDTSFNFDHQVFIDEKPGYYAFENETEDMTGAEIFAKYGAS
jgi:hypothetical protein